MPWLQRKQAGYFRIKMTVVSFKTIPMQYTEIFSAVILLDKKPEDQWSCKGSPDT